MQRCNFFFLYVGFLKARSVWAQVESLLQKLRFHFSSRACVVSGAIERETEGVGKKFR